MATGMCEHICPYRYSNRVGPSECQATADRACHRDRNMVDVVEEQPVVALGSKFTRLDAGRSADLRHLTAQQAATAMCEHFRGTGCAQADVSDPAEVRRLARLDCRRRGIRVTTLAGLPRFVGTFGVS